MTWYAVAAEWNADPRDHVWTVSNDPKRPGWDTDSGYDGYGLPRLTAEFLAHAANCLERLRGYEHEFDAMKVPRVCGKETTKEGDI